MTWCDFSSWCPGPPGPPGGLLVRNVAETSVELRWSRGYDNHSPIGRYVIMGRSSLSSQWKTMRTGEWICGWMMIPLILPSPESLNNQSQPLLIQIQLTSRATPSRPAWSAWCPGWITSSRSSPATSWAAESPACRRTPSARSKQVMGGLVSQFATVRLCRRTVETNCCRIISSLLTFDRAESDEISSSL